MAYAQTLSLQPAYFYDAARGRDTRLGEAAAVLALSWAIALCARVSIPLPFTPVPLTGSTLGVLLEGRAFHRLRLRLVDSGVAAPPGPRRARGAGERTVVVSHQRVGVSPARGARSRDPEGDSPRVAGGRLVARPHDRGASESRSGPAKPHGQGPSSGSGGSLPRRDRGGPRPHPRHRRCQPAQRQGLRETREPVAVLIRGLAPGAVPGLASERT